MTRYLLAQPGVFRTVQGEGALLGMPMVFVRLAGCSIGCPLCDTNYAAKRRVTVERIVSEVSSVAANGEWVWITGGEPTDQNPADLVFALGERFKVALATAGHRTVELRRLHWLSVSPHDPDKWVQDFGKGRVNSRRRLDWFRNRETEVTYALHVCFGGLPVRVDS